MGIQPPVVVNDHRSLTTEDTSIRSTFKTKKAFCFMKNDSKCGTLNHSILLEMDYNDGYGVSKV